MKLFAKLARAAEDFIIGWKFPVLMIAMFASSALLMSAMLLMPESDSAAAAFARDFKRWCFGYNPATGKLEWGYVLMYLFQPMLMSAVIVTIWIKPLRELWAGRRLRALPYIVWAMAIVLSIGFGLTAMSGADAIVFGTEKPTFDFKTMRTTVAPPPLNNLVNQDREAVNWDTLRGDVVLVTAVFARCGYTCPMILAQTRTVLDNLSAAEKADLRVVAITLDPDHDQPDTLKQMAQAQNVAAPFFNFVSGDPAAVNETLDRFGFERERDPETGVINHVNLFLLIDRQGRIAYRFTLGEDQAEWLTEAIRLLINEPATTAARS